ncbi:MAG TPA: hypothetical protein VEY10_04985, partial [Flavisolibacter sp.]|nr:hypothetical protein [Flavisolibacter sp.]
MSTKKNNANGADSAPVSAVLDGLEASPESIKKSNGKSKKTLVTAASEDELDNKELLRVLSEVRGGNFTARMPMDKFG